MKKMLFAMLMVLSFAFTASAAVQDFGSFTANVPDGWTAQKDGTVVVFLAPGNAAALSIAHDSTGGAAPEALAKEFAKQLKGTEPQAVDGAFVFEFTQNGVKSTSVLYAEKDKYALITMTDPSGKFEAQFNAIMDSCTDK